MSRNPPLSGHLFHRSRGIIQKFPSCICLYKRLGRLCTHMQKSSNASPLVSKVNPPNLADSLPDCSVEGAPAARTVPPALSFARAR
jgi:hypothetical protein